MLRRVIRSIESFLIIYNNNNNNKTKFYFLFLKILIFFLNVLHRHILKLRDQLSGNM